LDVNLDFEDYVCNKLSAHVNGFLRSALFNPAVAVGVAEVPAHEILHCLNVSPMQDGNRSAVRTGNDQRALNTRWGGRSLCCI
jgi:hypothetical protein